MRCLAIALLGLLALVVVVPGAHARSWNLAAIGAPPADARAGAGVVVAVLDSGVAYRSDPPYRRSPALPRWRFVRGFDAIDGDPRPHDRSGHGTHVAATVAAVAPGARIMPVRVLDARGDGDELTIARGVDFAVRGGADVINLSAVFGHGVRARELPHLLRALRQARRRGVVVVAAAGNDGRDSVPYPARDPTTIAVGATTISGCGATYSNYGDRIDLVAPGGGDDADVPGDARCAPSVQRPEEIEQLSFRGDPRRLTLRGRDGTSMAAPHVAAAAALVIASGVLGPDPSPRDVKLRLRATARDLGEEFSYGAGLVDVAATPSARPAVSRPGAGTARASSGTGS